MMTLARSLAAQALDILSPHPTREQKIDQAPMDEILIPHQPRRAVAFCHRYFPGHANMK